MFPTEISILYINIYFCPKSEHMSANGSSNCAECTGDVVRNVEVNNFFQVKRLQGWSLWLSLTLEVEYIMLYTASCK